ncbi:hypothetical protein H072_9008 [Dactylellina haptotyla CBS 200.50]|uniref:Proteasome activator subunit 4 n=1 Tax=Dactylellina haptotyla (strain CBS 200.50) TaxID=1284197 RepID=S8BDP2_DACHA|nr:hypothetical protein H072_9008 [Dactylellina haptotyla CBS 200.50]
MDQRFLDSLSIGHQGDGIQDISRTTTPGPGWQDESDDEIKLPRQRQRTFPYTQYLPYSCETEETRLRNLEDITKKLYIAVESGDFAPGALHWSRELRSWLQMKFDLPRHTRAKLVKLFYNLALSRGLTLSVSERFASMFMLLTKRKHYLKPGQDLYLDWYPLYKELKIFILPQETGFINTTHVKRNVRTLTKMCTFCQLYTSPTEIPRMLEEFLPYCSLSHTEGAFIVVGLLNLLMPTTPPPPTFLQGLPGSYLPGLFHIWALGNRSKTFDVNFLDLLSRLARDSLPASHVRFGPYGIFTKEQSATIFTAVLRLLEIPVGQASSPYSPVVDIGAGLAATLEKDPKKHPVAHHIARWVVMSLSPHSLTEEGSILVSLEGLIQAVETFFHPSNNGNWTKTLSQLAYYLSDFFVMRWNREQSGEMDIPEDRLLTPALKKRFVLVLREAVFMGIYSKSGTAMNFAMQSLQSLAFLEPDLILPGSLQRIYPAMQGLVEVHRTTSSLRALQVLASIIVRHKGYRIHTTTLLSLALPGIDANDLDKTLQTLAFIQSVAYNVPFYDLNTASPSPDGSEMIYNKLAVDWLQKQLEALESGDLEGFATYHGLPDANEEAILKSSTSGFGEFVVSFLERVFVLLENLPDASRVRSGSPEEAIVNTLPSTFLPLLAALSPELYDLALEKVADFVGNHVIHQARDAMAFICDALCKVNPEKALKRLLPLLMAGIKVEIEENGAASTRHSGADVLPRDRALVWFVTILSMCVVHVGSALLEFTAEILEITDYMQQKCKGIPAVHVSNLIHHLLLSLTLTYTNDFALDEASDSNTVNVGIETWGKIVEPQNLNINWHVPTEEEVRLATQIFERLSINALERLTLLINEGSKIKRDGVGKEWSDDVSRNLVLLRLLLSGIASLVDVSGGPSPDSMTLSSGNDIPSPVGDQNLSLEDDEDSLDPENGQQETFSYPTGYFFGDSNHDLYQLIHSLRRRIGEALHGVHSFLVKEQQDDVACFNALYTAYRSWFVDVRIERSAQVVERILRLFESDIHLFKISGLRKVYPRPLLLRRANLYHLQRLRSNIGPRKRTQLDECLLLDLAESAVSPYTEIRRHAQSAAESACKVIIGARPLVIPKLLSAFEEAVQTNNYGRMKGAMYTLLLGSLSKTVGRDWRFAPRVIKSFIAASAADKLSVQKLAMGATFQVIDYGRPLEQLVLLDEQVLEAIAPIEDVRELIAQRKLRVAAKAKGIELKKAELVSELVDLARGSHWKIANRTVTVMLGMGMRFDTLAEEVVIELMTRGSIDTHPMLRGLYCSGLIALFCLIDLRSACGHKYQNFLLDIYKFPSQKEIVVDQKDKEWTNKFLLDFAKEQTSFYVDFDHIGWLAWGNTMTIFEAQSTQRREWDSLESKVRGHIGRLVDREWFHALCEYMKQEPREGIADRFRMASPILLQFMFELVRDGVTVLTFNDISMEILELFGDGSDKNQHRATAEMFGALLNSTRDCSEEEKSQTWDLILPILTKTFDDGLNPDNLSYWVAFVHTSLQGKDLRRSWPIVLQLSNFRLDLGSNAAFKESSKIQLLQQCINDAGWHFRLHQPIWDDFIAHLDHPYKGVREAIGQTLACINRTRYHESFSCVRDFLEAQRNYSSVGVPPYQTDKELIRTFAAILQQLAKWRGADGPEMQSSSSYTSASKTVLLWLESTLSSHECTQLAPLFSRALINEILHMIDVREDPELMSLAYNVFRHLPDIPHPIGQDDTFIEGLIQTGSSASSWHQRLRVLLNIGVVYFRRLFLISPEQRRTLFSCVSNMLGDPQLEVRIGAATTLSGMIRCSPVPFRDRVVPLLKKRFVNLLLKNPLPRASNSRPGSPHQKLTVNRHAAVLGLSSLIQAFPYVSPPPSWLPEILTILALRAASDPGMVGESVKACLSDFKKTRQDTWHIDVKAFSSDQLEDLEGVLWKSYFA